MLKFVEFIDRKEREAKKQLKILEKVLLQQGFKVKEHLANDDPYLFIINPEKDTFFDGIRLYKIGDQIAFRVQKEEKTEPFGRAYPCDVEEMFDDLVSDFKPEEAAKKIMSAIKNEVNSFFKKSAIAERELRDAEFDRDPFGKVVVRSDQFGMDYSNLTYSKS